MQSVFKSIIDILIAMVLAVVLLPLFPFIAILIKLDSAGPIFYRCDRIGKDRKSFHMYKFRTMLEIPVRVGQSLSPQGDVRVTNFGRLLRRTKLNELPQLLNVFKGEMSFVGPRPEAPDLAAAYPPEAEILFSIKPGIVGPAQITFRNEEDLYPEGVDPKDYYIHNILPEKLKIDLEYLKHPTLLKDLRYMFLAFKETMLGTISRRHFFENNSQIYLFLFDMFFVVGCYLFAIELRFEGDVPAEVVPVVLKTFPILLFYRLICFIGFGLYGVLIRYLNVSSYMAVANAVTFSSILTGVTIYLIGFYSFPRSLLIIDWFCINVFMISIRVPTKLLRFRIYGKERNTLKKVLIFGAGDKGILAAAQLKSRVKILGFLDDDRTKRNKKVQDYSVVGNRYDIEPLSKIYHVDEVVIAVSNLDEKNLNHIVSLCHKASVRYSIFTTFVDSYTERVREEHLRARKIFRWLNGKEINMVPFQMDGRFSNKHFLLVGASNMLGLELLKYLSPFKLREVAILDKYEAYLSEMMQRGMGFLPKEFVKPFLATDPLPIEAGRIFDKIKNPCIVIHMGTRKYPSVLETDPLLIVKENILDTWELFETSRVAGCELFMMISYVGAAQPKNLIQSTLSLAEHYIQSSCPGSKTCGTIVRLFNLVENRGSILRTIQSQIRDGRKILLNHPEEERYFITASSAAKLILRSAYMAIDQTNGSPGIFISSYNGAVKVLDLAKFIIQDYGLDPGKDVEIGFLKDGDGKDWKESIHLDGRQVWETPDRSIKRIIPSSLLCKSEVDQDIEEFRAMVKAKDRDGLIRKANERVKKILDLGS
jgi:FlaA1/EpsC-like NDP-sugar epimerase/lipopolysaccharide/colanic/teichoic acid biosynthesis glycosyltransferase